MTFKPTLMPRSYLQDTTLNTHWPSISSYNFHLPFLKDKLLMLYWNFILLYILTIKWHWGTTESQWRCRVWTFFLVFCFKARASQSSLGCKFNPFFAVSANLFRLCKRFVCSLIIDILTALQGILHPNKRGLEPNMSIRTHWAHSLKIDIN